MSYCRWSSNNWKCDLYIYQTTNGYYTTHVARNRVVGEVPFSDWSSPETLYASEKAQADFLDTCRREPIGLPCDGMTFEYDSLTDLCASVVKLQAMGYIVPQWVVDGILDELEDLDDECE